MGSRRVASDDDQAATSVKDGDGSGFGAYVQTSVFVNDTSLPHRYIGIARISTNTYLSAALMHASCCDGGHPSPSKGCPKRERFRIEP